MARRSNPGYDRNFEKSSYGEYNRDFTFNQPYNQAMDLEAFDRDFERSAYGEYNRDFTYRQAYNRGSYDPGFRRFPGGEYNRDFTYNRAYQGYNLDWDEELERDERFAPGEVYPGGRISSERARDLEYGRRWDADNVAWDIPGPYSGIQPRNYKRRDDEIREDVNERLTWHGYLDAQDIQVTVEDGIVSLEGTVEDRRAKRMAEDAADMVRGVRDVMNRLRLRKQR